jgi:hypothetical protein
MNGLIDFNKSKEDIFKTYTKLYNDPTLESTYGIFNHYPTTFENNNMPLAPSLQISHTSHVPQPPPQPAYENRGMIKYI